MTTKNPEFEFDIQLFALDDIPKITATDGVISAGGADTATPTAVEHAETTPAGADGTYTVSTTYSKDIYHFSNGDATTAGNAVFVESVAGGLTTVVSQAYTAESSPSGDATTVYGSPDNTTAPSPLWLSGGTSKPTVQVFTSNTVVSDNVSLNTDAALELTASGRNISYSRLSGEMNIAPQNNATLRANINGATINANVGEGVSSNLNGATDYSNVTIVSGATNTTLNAVDTKQIWAVSGNKSLSYASLQVSAGSETIGVTGADDAGSYLRVNLDYTAGQSVNVTSTSTSAKDTISVNGTVLSGAGRIGAVVTATTDASVMTARATNAGTLMAGGNATVGGLANVAANSVTTLTSGAGTGSVPAITGVSALAAGRNSTWQLGSGVTTAQLGADTVAFANTGAGRVITADATNGTQVAAINAAASLNVVGDHTVNASGTIWTLNGGADTAGSQSTISANFDASGNATLSASAVDAANDLVANVGAASKTLAVGANGAADTLTMQQNGEVIINNNVVSAVNSIAAGSTWLVRGGTDSRQVSVTGATAVGDELGFNFERANNASVYGALTASTANGGAIESVASLTGNVTVAHGASSINMNVMGTNWSVGGEDSQRVVFDSTGLVAAVSVAGGSDLAIAAATGAATVNVDAMAGSISGSTMHSMSGSFNGVRVIVNDSDGIIGVGLDSDTAKSGISEITSLSSAATVLGDNQFIINDYFINKSASNVSSSDIRVTLGGASSISVQNVADGDAYTVTGLNNQTIYYDIDSTVASGGNARVTLNGAAATITASSASSVGNAYVVAGYNDAIATIGGIKANDTVNTASDRDFTVIYNTSDIANSTSSDPYVLAVNDARVSLRSANLTTEGQQSIAMSVAYDVADASKPHVTISRGIANNVTVTVGSGVYNVGQSAQVTINDPVGYLYVDNSGNVTAEDSLVAEIRQQREASLATALNSIASASPIAGPYHDFYNIYANLNNYNQTVAAYAADTVITPTIPASSNGANIYGDTTLSAHPQEVTLQTYLANPINVTHSEGEDGITTLRTAVIDVSNSNNTIVAIGYTGDDFTTNHTILGGNRASTLVVGSHAHGDNYVRAGNGGNYIYHTGIGKSTLLGGSGSDTIRATSDDYVEGGGGVDYFLDEGSFEITDYDFAGGAGDVIVATKLSTSAVINPANVTLSGNHIAIAGGSTLTVGDSSTYDEATATRAVVVNAAGSGRTNLIWAGNYDTALDASDLTRGAMMISYINGGAVNTVTGSAYSDTIYAGPNDIVDAGLGNDTVSLAAADSSAGQRGATVVLSTGKTDVYGWKGGFDNEAGANIIEASAASTNIRMRNGVVVASGEGASINVNTYSDELNNGAYNFLVGEEKVSFLSTDATVTVNGNDEIADYYKGDKSGIYFGAGIDTAFGVTLSNDSDSHFTGINKVALLSESRASIYGSSASESITLGGSADIGASKSVASGAGNDLIVSGGNDTAKAGHQLFFGEYGGVTLSAGRDTIRDFSYYKGRDIDPDVSSADVLFLGDSKNFQSISATANRLEFSLGENTKVIIQDNFAQSSDNKIVKVRFGDVEDTINCKFGLSNGTNTFTYDGETNFFYGSTSRNNDTLRVDSSLTNVNIWLADKTRDNKSYYGVRTIDASSVTETRTTLVGDSNNNVIMAGGEGSYNTLWGGGGQSNLLVGGEGEDVFFYFKSAGYTDNDGVHHGSNDVIQNAGVDDLIWLFDVSGSDISSVSEGIVGGRVSVNLNDGSSITVNTTAASTNFRISDGNGGWQDFRATSGTNHGWE